MATRPLLSPPHWDNRSFWSTWTSSLRIHSLALSSGRRTASSKPAGSSEPYPSVRSRTDSLDAAASPSPHRRWRLAARCKQAVKISACTWPHALSPALASGSSSVPRRCTRARCRRRIREACSSACTACCWRSVTPWPDGSGTRATRCRGTFNGGCRWGCSVCLLGCCSWGFTVCRSPLDGVCGSNYRIFLHIYGF